MVEQRQSTHKMRMDLANTLIPDLDLYDAAFTRHGLHYLYLLVASITRDINMVEQRQSTQKMRMDLETTLRPDLDLYDAAFMSYRVH